jgi:hypothetical protein
MRRLLDPSLCACLGILAVAGSLVTASGGARVDHFVAAPPDLPWRIGPYTAVDGAPEQILPTDPRARHILRRTYLGESRAVWLSIATYPGTNNPRTRPAVHRIVPETNASSIARRRLSYGSPGPVASAAINAVVVRHAQAELALAYWYRLDRDVVADEYDLRWRLFSATLLNRRLVVTLVRLATDRPSALSSVVELFFPAINGSRHP